MAEFGESSALVKCSFCGKSQKQVAKLIAGPGVYICNECIGLCNDIIENEGIVTQEGAVISPRSEAAPRSEEDAKVIEAREALTGRLGRRPSVAELAAEVGLDEEALTEVLRRASPARPEASATAWKTSARSPTPVPIALRTIHWQLNELAKRLGELTDRIEGRDGP